MKVVYALICNKDDKIEIFFDMALISGTSVKLSNKNFKILMATNEETRNLLKDKQHLLFQIVDEWVLLNVPAGDTRWRSRYLKTSLASHIQGPFLFLDVDTLIRKSIAPIFSLTCDLAAATNGSTTDRSKQLWEGHRKIFELLSWPQGDRDYYNSGVIFFSGSSASKEFAKAWHAAWLQCAEATRSYEDQMAFNHVLGVKKLAFDTLPVTFNAQIWSAPEVAFDATIWHFYAATINSCKTVFTNLVRKVQSGSIKKLRSAVACASKKRFPWTLQTPHKMCVISFEETFRKGERLRWSELSQLLCLCPSAKTVMLAICVLFNLKYYSYNKVVQKKADLKNYLKILTTFFFKILNKKKNK